MGAARILLAEDNAHYREALRTLLCPPYEIVGEASDGAELIETARNHSADVVISDIAMPKMSGFEAARQLSLLTPLLKVVFLSSHKHVDYVKRAMALGAAGFVSKSRAATDLPKAIECVLRGDRFFEIPDVQTT